MSQLTQKEIDIFSQKILEDYDLSKLRVRRKRKKKEESESCAHCAHLHIAQSALY